MGVRNGFLSVLPNILNPTSASFNTAQVRMIIFLQHTGGMRKAAHSWRQLAWHLQLPQVPTTTEGLTPANTCESFVAHSVPWHASGKPWV